MILHHVFYEDHQKVQSNSRLHSKLSFPWILKDFLSILTDAKINFSTSVVAFQFPPSNYDFHIKTLVTSSTKSHRKYQPSILFVMNIYIGSKKSILEHATPIKFSWDSDVPIVNSMAVQQMHINSVWISPNVVSAWRLQELIYGEIVGPNKYKWCNSTTRHP
jgi:hypothetical protein